MLIEGDRNANYKGRSDLEAPGCRGVYTSGSLKNSDKGSVLWCRDAEQATGVGRQFDSQFSGGPEVLATP